MTGPGPRAKAKRQPPRDDTEKVVGVGAARATLSSRAGDVLHIAYSGDALKAVSELLKQAARLRIAYREVSREELGRIAGTLHHEGICMQVRKRPSMSLSDLLAALPERGFVVALDHVENPHNIGALLRSAAYFGASALLVHGTERTELTPSTVRIAEGGAEHVPVCFVSDLASALDRLKERGMHVVGADAHRGRSVFEARLPSQTVLVLGSERHGLSRGVSARCQLLVRIEGTDAVESLNVSVAAGILMAHAAQAVARTP